ncbi:VOC family protein [Nocardia sp. 2]|uniref:VOC family protein n=1 Tax=Nocardia acididurans TaxID=2802282 RepID=A0ABS1M9B2_9NOCA|nr:VOC family protein [Nocardia acididurans]MBL1077237.1 VOC family protein [Nocardia acididurans]
MPGFVDNSLQVGITPRDLRRSMHFYREVLGVNYEVPLVTSGIVLHRFRIGAAVLKLAEGISAPAHNPAGGPPAATGLRWVSVDVDDLQAIVERLATVETSFVTPIMADESGTRFAIIEDPDGIWIELIQQVQSH